MRHVSDIFVSRNMHHKMRIMVLTTVIMSPVSCLSKGIVSVPQHCIADSIKLIQVQQMIRTAAALLPQGTGQAQLTEASPLQPSTSKASAAPAKWNAPVLTKKVSTQPAYNCLTPTPPQLHDP